MPHWDELARPGRAPHLLERSDWYGLETPVWSEQAEEIRDRPGLSHVSLADRIRAKPALGIGVALIGLTSPGCASAHGRSVH